MIVYQIVRDDDGYYVAHLLLDPKSSKITEFRGYEKVREFHDPIGERYPGATYIPKRAFQEEIEKRSIHTPAMLAILSDNYMGEDFSAYIVYGSPSRPMSAVWARIEGAIFFDADVRGTGYHSYVAVPAPLAKEVIERFELVFVSRPVAIE